MSRTCRTISVCVIGVPEGKDKEIGAEKKKFEEIMAKYSTNFVENIIYRLNELSEPQMEKMKKIVLKSHQN